ncbi:MAG TPA: cellulose binding domain-containing protein [Natronosporangium sp.]
MQRSFIRTVLPIAAALAAVLAAVLIAQPAYSQAPVRIMPLGDSITGSPGCWRALLWQQLQNTGYTNVDFVGTLPPQGCGFPYDGEHEGHGGFLVTNVAAQNQLPGWLAATNPDVVLMHFGTNDVWSNRPTDQILAAYGTLVDQMRANNPSMTVLVAQIIPMNPSTCGECAQRVVALNNAIPGWAASKTTSQSPVVVVDQWTGFDTATDTYDGVHPNAAGDQKMAGRWYPALTAVLDGTPVSPPPTSPSTSPSTAPTASPPPAPGGCTAEYRITSQWQGGFQGGVRVTNPGSTTINGWTVRFSFPNGQQVTQFWAGEISQEGAEVSALPAAWNRILAPSASVEFGFLASWDGTTNQVPSPVTCTPG